MYGIQFPCILTLIVLENLNLLRINYIKLLKLTVLPLRLQVNRAEQTKCIGKFLYHGCFGRILKILTKDGQVGWHLKGEAANA